jgi:predicted O-methyltransferase YrrM
LLLAMTSPVQQARTLRRELAFLVALRVLPPRIAFFQARARLLAARRRDEFGPVAATRPPKLATLLRLAQGRSRVVELGTAAGWTSISLLLADSGRTLLSYDIIRRPQLDLYLALAPPDVRRRLELVCAPGEQGPRSREAVDLLYVDSSHECAATIREWHAWQSVLAPGAVVVFDDYTHPQYPGVREAIEQLALTGEVCEGFFVHRTEAAPTVTAAPTR